MKFLIIAVVLFVLYLIFLCVIYDIFEAQELRSELDLDSEEIKMYIDGKWYSESEVVALVYELQKRIRELEKLNEFYLEHIRNHKEEDKEVYD